MKRLTIVLMLAWLVAVPASLVADDDEDKGFSRKKVKLSEEQKQSDSWKDVLPGVQEEEQEEAEEKTAEEKKKEKEKQQAATKRAEEKRQNKSKWLRRIAQVLLLIEAERGNPSLWLELAALYVLIDEPWEAIASYSVYMTLVPGDTATRDWVVEYAGIRRWKCKLYTVGRYGYAINRRGEFGGDEALFSADMTQMIILPRMEGGHAAGGAIGVMIGEVSGLDMEWKPHFGVGLGGSGEELDAVWHGIPGRVKRSKFFIEGRLYPLTSRRVGMFYAVRVGVALLTIVDGAVAEGEVKDARVKGIFGGMGMGLTVLPRSFFYIDLGIRGSYHDYSRVSVSGDSASKLDDSLGHIGASGFINVGFLVAIR